jgi:hypothetical protein
MNRAMRSQKRKYISIYFHNGKIGNRKKRDVTISFENGDPLYEKCRRLGSSKIKEIIDTGSYKDLVTKANKDERPLGNYIKYILKKRIEQ